MSARGFSKKKLLSGWGFFSIICVVMVLIAAYLPDMGENILKYKLIKGIAYILLGISFLIPLILHFLQSEDEYTVNGRPRQESLEEMMENGTGHVSIRTVITLVLGIILLCTGLKTAVACAKDVKAGPVWVQLESSRVESGSGSDTQSSSGNYKLLGLANGEEYIFRLEGKEMYDNLMRKINYQVPEIIVVYYPHSEAIIQMQIYFDNNEKLVLPEGDRAYDSRSLEKLPEGKGEEIEDVSKYEKGDGDNAGISLSKPTAIPGTYGPTAPRYSQVDLEELNLPEGMVGADFVEMLQELANLPEEERYVVMYAISDVDEYMEHYKRVVLASQEYEVTKEQGCDILYREDVELLKVYRKKGKYSGFV